MIKKLINFIISILPPKKTIVFESSPDVSDNAKAVFDEMLKQGLNCSYKLYWICFEHFEKGYARHKNVRYIQVKRYWTTYLIKRSKVVICSNRFIFSDNKKAFNMYLGHGNPIKNTKNYYIIPDKIQNILASSDWMKQFRSKYYGYESDRIISLGYPRNDALTEPKHDLHLFFHQKFEKVIVWYPTVRQFKGGRTTASKHAFPIIWNEKRAVELNKLAKSLNVLIVLKPHFAQDVSKFKELNLDNVIFINDVFLNENNITSYQFVGSCDALLSDYSSIYYDFTLCDKPIGLIWEDYNDYKRDPGFSVDMEYMMQGGVKIFTLDDLFDFIKDVSKGVDRLKTERRIIRDLSNYSCDGKNSERVVNYIKSKAGL